MSQETVLRNVGAASAGASINFDGIWRNQLGSTAEFTVQGGAVSGLYTSAVSTGGGSIQGPISGFINGDLIAWTVNWPKSAITAWVGQLTIEGGTETIKTLWQMTTNVPDAEEPTGLWHSVYAGTDTFTR